MTSKYKLVQTELVFRYLQKMDNYIESHILRKYSNYKNTTLSLKNREKI
jgi:hypothetical protein